MPVAPVTFHFTECRWNLDRQVAIFIFSLTHYQPQVGCEPRIFTDFHE
jgi:hypothetical protein